MSSSAEVDSLKQKGNEALQAGRSSEAIDLYTKAIGLAPDNAVLYSNRSAAYSKSLQYNKALEDAEKAIELRSDWAKGYSRKGNALAGLNRHEEAMMAYMEGLNYDSTNESLKEGIKNSKMHLSGPGGSQPLVNPFADAQLWQKLEADPRTKDFLKDPSFKATIEKIQRDPGQLGTYMKDSRVMTALGVALGVELSMAENSQPNTKSGEEPMETENTYEAKEKPKPKAKTPEKQSEAVKEKELGNAAYKKRDFETALSHYNKAVEMEPTDIVYRNNRAAVYFEQKEYDKCIAECEESVEIGRQNRADFKLIAKTLSRIGNAYSKKEELETALTYYNKSLSEHRDQEVVKKAAQIDKAIKEKKRLAYIDPEKALEEKEKGNKSFSKGDYPTAIKCYTEAIKRNPDDAKLFSNRAACYTKLAEFNMAVKDAEECIRLDPNFVKGYLRKAASLVAMKDLSKAASTYQKAMNLDPQCQEAIDGYRRCLVEDNDPEAVKKRAMQDPEVQEILSDPAMQLILQQMQKEPKALQEHLKNPHIMKKIEKLLDAGLIGIR